MSAYSAQADKPSKAAGLKRVKQEMVKPPFFRNTRRRQRAAEDRRGSPGGRRAKKLVIDPQGRDQRADLHGQRSRPRSSSFIKATTWSSRSSIPGPGSLLRHRGMGRRRGEHHEPQHRPPRRDRCAGRRRAHPGIAPGQEATIRFKATKAGVFVYHCAPGGAMIPYHVVAGMNGAIMVLPRDGLKDKNGKPLRYDKAYYIGEQDFYVPKGPGREQREVLARRLKPSDTPRGDEDQRAQPCGVQWRSGRAHGRQRAHGKGG